MAVLCQAYEIYADGLLKASKVLSCLELNEQFRHFMLKAADKNNLQLCEFINRPLRHIQELTGILRNILDTTFPSSQEYTVFSQIVQGKGFKYCLNPFQQNPDNIEKEAFRKHCGKRRKCWGTSIFSFPHNVFYPS